MPFTYQFDTSTITTAGLLERGLFSKGTGPGIDNPTHYSATAPYQSISTYGGVDVVAMTLVAGQSYTFDIDNGTGGSSYIDLQLDIINQAGTLVRTVDNTTSGRDPYLTFTPSVTGTYYVAVHQSGNDYINGSFRFEGVGNDTGDYILNISTPVLPLAQALTSNSDTRSYTDFSAQRVYALGGNDTVWLYSGNDIALGGDGADRLFGGTGSDELSGNAGADRLYGEAGDDVLNGGSAGDILYGGADRDSVNGGSGNDLAYGGSGNDFVWGNSGNDTLLGEGGNDTLRGGTGVDRLYGGAGADSFHFMAGEANFDPYGFNEDRIHDFDYYDVIDLSDMAWGTLAWRGSLGFTGANQVRVATNNDGSKSVQVNLDSDGTPEQCILVNASFTLTSSDFIL